MKNKIVQLSILGFLTTAIFTAESCKKEDPPAETIQTNNNSTTGNGSSGSGSGSGGGSGSGSGNTNCNDIDSPTNGTTGACKYAYTAGYEISSMPLDDDGSAWDPFGGNPDLILKIKEQGASGYIFESAEISGHDPSSAANWAAPSPVKLLNKTYEWELVDYDPTSADDLMSSGTFNPITSANSGVISVTGTQPSTGAQSQLKITYTLQ